MTTTQSKQTDTRDDRGCFVNRGGVTVQRFEDLPAQGFCKICRKTKRIDKMVVVRHRKDSKDHRAGQIYMRPRCKTCHNKKERGHRREYKTKYLRAWRKRNKTINDSYWQTDEHREQMRVNALRRWRDPETHDAMLIKARFKNMGRKITIAEARSLLQQFGRAYPMALGLTPAGRKEVERIRNAFRRRGRRKKLVEIRMMVYEDGLFIKPENQRIKNSGDNLRRWHEEQRKRKQEQTTCKHTISSIESASDRETSKSSHAQAKRRRENRCGGVSVDEYAQMEASATANG